MDGFVRKRLEFFEAVFAAYPYEVITSVDVDLLLDHVLRVGQSFNCLLVNVFHIEGGFDVHFYCEFCRVVVIGFRISESRQAVGTKFLNTMFVWSDYGHPRSADTSVA